ncbi:MAG: hypothetical protein LPJ89_09530 [Hymenobacteraceae bacterium]|nr:hypothetical protein [Hymenobacteraceae bacterium]MDX5394628.1 hypothetical protein [Hymenobacteraceae bacterium]MDX5444006.1 hypothetical protein [Hymenobacteraceae bacterium]MDX5510659.1 hypothetical protein [Hymenobacteraceae bacterium]
MFDRGNLSLFPHAYKYAGFAIAALAFAGWLALYFYITPETVAASVASDKPTVLRLLNWIAVVGLFMAAFSKQHYHDCHPVRI